MKPLYAQYVVSFDSKHEAYLLFRLIFEDKSTKHYRIYSDKDFQEPRHFNIVETLESERADLTAWQIVLFNTWKNERNQSGHNKASSKNDLFHFSGNEESGFNCRISKKMAADIFTETEENNRSAWMADDQGCFASVSSFFQPAPEVEFYEFNKRLDSTFSNAQIDRIESLIHDLEKEMNSIWYPNKVRKAIKVHELKTLLDLSTKMDPYSALTIILKNPDVTAGYISTRTSDLLNDLQKEALSMGFGQINTMSAMG
ncbi:MAG: hypothetical protein H0T84_09050 [Tatlockia sp.]|nr:hypothetical protein [Tatlockia sp.]